VRDALRRPGSDWHALAERLRRQRLDPLEPYLIGANRLVILPSTAMAGIPVEVFAGKYTVSYALSGTMHAYLRTRPEARGEGLLALGDPVFQRPEDPRPASSLPPGGLLITAISPGGNAHRNGLRVGDVLLRYADRELKTHADILKLIQEHARDAEVPVLVWREDRDKPVRRNVQPGKLDVVFSAEPAPQALAEKRQTDQWLASRGSGEDKWERLPNTRYEVEALRDVFGRAGAVVLLDSDASEQQLHDRATHSVLGKCRYIHLATHGEANDRFPLRSALILSQDRLPDPGKQLDAGRPVFDGELTAEEILQQWNLNADLVTLSACQTALGKYEGGEGFVGFAQALTLAGSRAVCLSLWNVNDTATALLMKRFYENMLGRRTGLKAPMTKAAALAEAKVWLRGLSPDEALKLTAKFTKGDVRGKGAERMELVQHVGSKENGPRDHPYSHPYYWAAFVLFGECD
jgi:hypothetical protein